MYNSSTLKITSSTPAAFLTPPGSISCLCASLLFNFHQSWFFGLIPCFADAYLLFQFTVQNATILSKFDVHNQHLNNHQLSHGHWLLHRLAIASSVLLHLLHAYLQQIQYHCLFMHALLLEIALLLLRFFDQPQILVLSRIIMQKYLGSIKLIYPLRMVVRSLLYYAFFSIYSHLLLSLLCLLVDFSLFYRVLLSLLMSYSLYHQFLVWMSRNKRFLTSQTYFLASSKWYSCQEVWWQGSVEFAFFIDLLVYALTCSCVLTCLLTFFLVSSFIPFDCVWAFQQKELDAALEVWFAHLIRQCFYHCLLCFSQSFSLFLSRFHCISWFLPFRISISLHACVSACLSLLIALSCLSVCLSIECPSV